MSPRHSTALLTDFAWFLALLAAVLGVIWFGFTFEWARPWLIGWVVFALVFGPVLTMMFFSGSRDEEEQDHE